MDEFALVMLLTTTIITVLKPTLLTLSFHQTGVTSL